MDPATYIYKKAILPQAIHKHLLTIQGLQQQLGIKKRYRVALSEARIRPAAYLFLMPQYNY